MNAISDTKSLGNIIFLEFLVAAKYRLYRHLILISFISIGLFYGNDNLVIEPGATIGKIIGIVLLLSLFYLNMYVLIPKLLFRNNYLDYGFAIIVLIVIFFILVLTGRHLLKPYFNNPQSIEPFNVFLFFFMFFVLVIASAGVKLFQRWIWDTQKINDLEKATLQSELEQLKNQINPHFLFNMLNNANVLTQKDPAKASQVLMKLSDLLRYQLYDSSRTKVLLTPDIHFIEDVLNLEKIRRDVFEFIVIKEGYVSGVQIVPLLFITFVENAVKHNMDGENGSYVHVYFDLKNDVLFFKCINSKPDRMVNKKVNGGLGLANVKRRLELIYPQKHALKIEDNKKNYTVALTINL